MRSDQPGFVDIHTHILHGVDDGATDLEQAMSMLEMAWADGTHRIVLTPHYRRSFQKSPQELREAFDTLRHAASIQLPEMELYLGAEIATFHEVPQLLREGKLLTINETNHVLAEFPPGVSRTNLFHGIDRLLDGGYIPVMAHAERCTIMTPQIAAELVRQGVLLQVNAGSVLGKHGLRTMWLCRKLLKEGLVFCIASDAHDTQHRVPQLQRCYKMIRNRYGERDARRLFIDNPECLLR